MKLFLALLLTVIGTVSASAFGAAGFVFVIKFFVEVFKYDVAFWTALWSNAVLWIITEIISAVLFVLCSALAAAIAND